MSYHLSAACGCNTGRRRDNNEDNFYFNRQYLPAENQALADILVHVCTSEKPVSFGVFDGMGGQADGQIASYIAAKVFSDCSDKVLKASTGSASFLKASAKRMTDAVWAKADESFSNMGTTAAILRFDADNFYVCNVGDSRAFRFRQGRLRQLSKDHTDEEFLKAEGIARRKPRLTQYIGVSPEELCIEPYIARGTLKDQDQYLICSDGLTDMLSNDEIIGILQMSGAAREKVSLLIKTALDHGGRDNVTVIVVQVSVNEPALDALNIKPKKAEKPEKKPAEKPAEKKSTEAVKAKPVKEPKPAAEAVSAPPPASSHHEHAPRVQNPPVRKKHSMIPAVCLVGAAVILAGSLWFVHTKKQASSDDGQITQEETAAPTESPFIQEETAAPTESQPLQTETAAPAESQAPQTETPGTESSTGDNGYSAVYETGDTEESDAELTTDPYQFAAGNSFTGTRIVPNEMGGAPGR